MTFASTRAARRLLLLALAPLALGWAGCGPSSSGTSVQDETKKVMDISTSAKDNYMKTRSANKASQPGSMPTIPVRVQSRR